MRTPFFLGYSDMLRAFEPAHIRLFSPEWKKIIFANTR
jgi:hypothetical protein